MLTNPTLKSWTRIHKWTSLVCTVFILLLCLTGLPLIFADEIDHALGHRVVAPVLPEPAGNVAVDTVINAARALRPNDAVQFLSADSHAPDLWFVSMGVGAETTASYTFDARTGALLSEYPLNQGFMNILLRLHVDLFAGTPGTLFLGLMGTLLLISLVSGVVLYAPFMRKLAFGTVRYGQSSRLVWLDWHNLTGIATLAWLFVVGLTGVINSLAEPILDQWQAGELADMLAPYQDQPVLPLQASVEQVLAAAAMPNKSLSFLAFPGSPFAGQNHFIAYLQGKTPLTSQLLTPVLIDAQTGMAVDSRDLPPQVTALLISKPLHFGDYGGLPLKIIWALLDVLAIVVLYSGLVLWLKKRRGTGTS